MGEININPLFNVQDKYKTMHIINPYRFEGTTLKEGLISCWEFDEVSGITVYDSHENNNGTNNGLNINQTGIINKSYSSSGGSTNRIEIPTGLVKGNSALSISLWTRFLVSSGNQGLFSYWYQSGKRSILFRFNSGDIQAYTYTSSQAGGSFNVSPSTQQWYHLVLVYDGASMKLFVDGFEDPVSFSQSGVLGEAGDHEGYIANYYTSSALNNSLSGFVDQTAVWSRALTIEEINTLNNNGNGLAYENW